MYFFGNVYRVQVKTFLSIQKTKKKYNCLCSYPHKKYEHFLKFQIPNFQMNICILI